MKYSIILLILCIASMTGFSQNDKPRTNTTAAQMEAASEIPTPINTWVGKNYPSNKVVRNNMNKSEMSSAHMIYLDNGVTLQFNDKNEITGIDGKSDIPTTLVPEKIRSYVNTADKSRTIYSWQWVDQNTQQITLDNGQKMQFNKAGEYIVVEK